MYLSLCSHDFANDWRSNMYTFIIRGVSAESPINWNIFCCERHCEAECVSTCTVVNKHHMLSRALLKTSMMICLNSWPLIKTRSLKQSHILCILYILWIETHDTMWNTGLYSQGNWTCMITAMLSSAVHTNLPSMKSDLIKIVWIKFVFRFESLNLPLCVYWVWYDACAVDENMLILTLPYSAVKPDSLGSRAFNSEGLNMLFNVVQDNDCGRAM